MNYSLVHLHQIRDLVSQTLHTEILKFRKTSSYFLNSVADTLNLVWACCKVTFLAEQINYTPDRDCKTQSIL